MVAADRSSRWGARAMNLSFYCHARRPAPLNSTSRGRLRSAFAARPPAQRSTPDHRGRIDGLETTASTWRRCVPAPALRWAAPVGLGRRSLRCSPPRSSARASSERQSRSPARSSDSEQHMASAGGSFSLSGGSSPCPSATGSARASHNSPILDGPVWLYLTGYRFFETAPR